ncbi:MAG: hypothetical protein K2M06_03595 [Muribaculaceae bacterium]|nr:hypothetical protein [Muribaculaceae bacterium]
MRHRKTDGKQHRRLYLRGISTHRRAASLPIAMMVVMAGVPVVVAMFMFIIAAFHIYYIF